MDTIFNIQNAKSRLTMLSLCKYSKDQFRWILS